MSPSPAGGGERKAQDGDVVHGVRSCLLPGGASRSRLKSRSGTESLSAPCSRRQRSHMMRPSISVECFSQVGRKQKSHSRYSHVSRSRGSNFWTGWSLVLQPSTLHLTKGMGFILASSAVVNRAADRRVTQAEPTRQRLGLLSRQTAVHSIASRVPPRGVPP